MCGGKPGGLRELNSIQFESSKSNFLAPDTIAGKLCEKETSEELVKKFFALPPNKRTNYSKFSITCPFSRDWNLLLKEWNNDRKNIENNFFVLRDKTLLRKIQVSNKNNTCLVYYVENLLIYLVYYLSYYTTLINISTVVNIIFC